MSVQVAGEGSLRRNWWLIALGVVVAALLPMVVAPWTLSIVVRILVFALFGLAFNVAYGYTGLASFGHAAFFGLGGYGFGLVLINFSPGSVVLPIVVGVLAALLYGAFMALFSTRGRGIYFALLTFAFAQILYEVTIRWSDLLGGTQGLILATPPVFGFSLWNTTVSYYVTATVFIVCTVLLYRLITSPLGNVMRAVKENEERARAIGYPVKRVKIAVFTISATFAGVAGVLHSITNQYVSPSMLHFATSIDALIVAILGGVSFFLGPVLGAAVLVAIREFTTEYANVGIMITGLFFIVIVMYMPDGILGFVFDTDSSNVERLRNLWPGSGPDKHGADLEDEKT